MTYITYIMKIKGLSVEDICVEKSSTPAVWIFSETAYLKQYLYQRGMEAKNSPFFLWHHFNEVVEKQPCTKFFRVSISSHKVLKLQSFETGVSDVILVNVQNISALAFFAHFCEFYGKRTFCGRLDHLLERIKCLYASDVIHANEHTEYVNCDLRVNFLKFWLMSFCFVMRKDHFKQKLLLWSKIPFKFHFCSTVEPT